MRRIGFAALVALIAAVPAWARIDIIAAQVLDTGEVLINLDARSEPKPVRLDVLPDNKANIAEVTDTNEPEECMKTSAPFYADWVEWGRPACWCYIKQCRGDINGSSFFGKPLSISDLNILKAAFNQPDEILSLNPELICADLNHASFFGKRVTLADLNIFKHYIFLQRGSESIPECDSTHYNYWETP